MTNDNSINSTAPLLLSVGCLNVDLLINLDRIPTSGERIMSHGFVQHLGGMSTNLACAASYQSPPWGLSVELVAPVAADANGEFAQSQLSRFGVSTAGLERGVVERTCQCVVLVLPDAERTIISEPTILSKDWVAARIAAWRDRATTRHLHIDGLHAERVVDLVAHARAAGWRTSVDLDELAMPFASCSGPGGPARLLQLLRAFDVVFINRRLASAITNLAAEGEIATALSGLAQSTGATFVLTLGRDGAVVVEPDASPEPVPAPRVESVDSTGAGDVFAGVFLASWLNGESIASAASYACYAASYATTAAGAMGRLLGTEEIRRSG